MRALSLGQDQSQQPQQPPSTDYCVSFMQSLLLGQGRITPADRTGYMNDRTAAALTMQYGNGWQSFPGGLCALAAAGGVFPTTGYGYGSGYNYNSGYYPQTNPMTTLLLLGGAAVAVFLILRK